MIFFESSEWYNVASGRIGDSGPFSKWWRVQWLLLMNYVEMGAVSEGHDEWYERLSSMIFCVLKTACSASLKTVFGVYCVHGNAIDSYISPATLASGPENMMKHCAKCWGVHSFTTISRALAGIRVVCKARGTRLSSEMES